MSIKTYSPHWKVFRNPSFPQKGQIDLDSAFLLLSIFHCNFF